MSDTKILSIANSLINYRLNAKNCILKSIPITKNEAYWVDFEY